MRLAIPGARWANPPTSITWRIVRSIEKSLLSGIRALLYGIAGLHCVCSGGDRLFYITHDALATHPWSEARPRRQSLGGAGVELGDEALGGDEAVALLDPVEE